MADSLGRTLELLQLLHLAAAPHGALGPSESILFSRDSRFAIALDELRARLQQELAADDATVKRDGDVQRPGSPAGDAASEGSESRQLIDQKEKRKDMLLRVGAALKDLVGCVRAPGKKD